MPARTSSEPLTPDERRRLQLARQRLDGGVRATVTAIVSLAILGPVMFGWMVSAGVGPRTTAGWIIVAGIVIACVLGAALVWTRARRVREDARRPLIAALASDRKQVTVGRLGSIQADEHGGLRYQVDGDILGYASTIHARIEPDGLRVRTAG